MAPTPERPPDAQTTACPCRHGDVPAELAGQRPLLERAAAGDREAFALLYDDQVEGVYRYLLAWTGDHGEAAELAGQVFRGALGWLPVTAGGHGEAGAWLVAMARDAIAQRRGPAPAAVPDGPRGPAGDAVAAVARLGDPKREVVVLRLLCGHTLDHTAHLSGFSRRAVLELQLAACLAVWELTAGTRAGTAAPAPQEAAAEEFERRLGGWEIDLAGDPALAGALAAAGALRQAVPGYVAAPDHVVVERLRRELVTAEVAGPAAGRAPAPGPAGPAVAAGRVGRSKRPWVATAVATAGIVVILTLQAFGDPAPPGACDGRPCPAPTTAAAAAAGSLGIPLTTILPPSTTTSTVAGPAPASSVPRSAAATTPPGTRPAATAPPTTIAPRPPTTTRTPTTTAPPTTAATTTTAAPAPT